MLLGAPEARTGHYTRLNLLNMYYPQLGAAEGIV